MFLSKAERDYLTSNEEINHDYVCVKSRLHKKLREFNRQELPLLVQKGLVDIAEICKIAENCKVQGSNLVRIAPQTWQNNHNEIEKEKSNGGPGRS